MKSANINIRMICRKDGLFDEIWDIYILTRNQYIYIYLTNRYSRGISRSLCQSRIHPLVFLFAEAFVIFENAIDAKGCTPPPFTNFTVISSPYASSTNRVKQQSRTQEEGQMIKSQRNSCNFKFSKEKKEKKISTILFLSLDPEN